MHAGPAESFIARFSAEYTLFPWERLSMRLLWAFESLIYRCFFFILPWEPIG